MSSIFKSYGLDNINDYDSLRCTKSLNEGFTRAGDIQENVAEHSDCSIKKNIINECVVPSNRTKLSDNSNTLLKRK